MRHTVKLPQIGCTYRGEMSEEIFLQGVRTMGMATSTRHTLAQLTTLTLLLMASTTGCVVDQALVQNPGDVLGMGDTATPPAACTPPRDTSTVLHMIKPAISVRAASCLMCHAKINSSVITDFGLGDSFFMGGKNATNYLNFYFDYWDSWQSAEINGSVIVPRVQVQRADSAPLMNLVDPHQMRDQMSLAELISLPNVDLNGATVLPEMVTGVVPESGTPRVIEKDHIYIGAPTDADIQSIAPALFQSGSTERWQQVSRTSSSPSPSPITGLEVYNGVSSVYVKNSPNVPFVCDGDLVVKGVLLLKDLNIQTGDSGCRLYVTGSVFFQGGVHYLNDNGKANLQITSSAAIMMGFNAATAKRRLSLTDDNVNDYKTVVLPYFYLRGPGSNFDKQSRIYRDVLQVPDMKDADAVAKEIVDGYQFEHILLNAPQIHSRYIRPFKGVIVGEMVIFRLGKFDFSFDPIFASVEALPALPVEVLSARDIGQASEPPASDTDECSVDGGGATDTGSHPGAAGAPLDTNL